MGYNLLNPALAHTSAANNIILAKTVKVGHAWESRPQDVWKLPNECNTIIPLMGYEYVLLFLFLALEHVCFSDLLKPFLVEEHQNEPFNLLFPTRGVPICCSNDEDLPYVFLRWSSKEFYKEDLLLPQISHHPQTSGKVERMNGIFKLNLAQLSETAEFPWFKVLPLAFQLLWIRILATLDSL